MLLFGNVTQIQNANGAPAPITIPTTTTVYSHSFRLNYGQSFGIWLQAGNGSGTAKMKIELEQSYRPPTTEGSSDSGYVVGDGVADIESALNDVNAHVKVITPVPMKWARLKITGLDTNPADATINAWIFEQGLSG